MIVVCITCGVEFDKEPNQARRYPRHFCSRSCAAKTNNRTAPKRQRIRRVRICLYCLRIFELRNGSRAAMSQFHCGRRCARLAYLREQHGSDWSGEMPGDFRQRGKFIDRTKGYVLVYVPDHPRATNRGYVYEHRYVVEQNLGRYLKRDEHVHHRNGKRWDNRLENLELMHASDHAKLGGQRPEDLVI